MKTIRFSKIRFLMLILSIVIIGGGAVTTIIRGGINLGIDFQAGLSIRVAIDPARADSTIESVRSALSDVGGAQVKTIGEEAARQYVIRVSDPGDIASFSTVASRDILDSLHDEFGDDAIEELENTFVGPRFSEDLAQNTIILTTLALIVILAYIWFRFRLGYATAAITALVHDVAFMVAFIGAFQIEVSTATIAAVLTIIGYSLNDTIVIFDRVRENETIMRESGFETIINSSISQSLSRTLITSFTTLLAVTAIFVFATGTVKLFALNMIVGVVVGTYSSIFIASPVLLGWQHAAKKRKARKDAERHGAPGGARATASDKVVSPAAETGVSVEEKQHVIDEISRRKSASAGRSSSRAKRKKK
ncbi:MAG: protein translocase subunit SecF [Spirochaetales bacterium]|nr:protein translocase subunit SecF [Spirochaetales bacterium]